MFQAYLRYLELPRCHQADGDPYAVTADRQVQCSHCGHTLLDLVPHLAQLPARDSSLLARYYAESTGDVQIPCNILLTGVPGIRPTQLLVPYSTLLGAVQLLGVVNGEFYDYTACPLFDRSGTLRAKIIEHFVSNYVQRVREMRYEREDIDSLIKSLLEQMKNVFDTEQYNVIEYYLHVLCPYVKNLAPAQEPQTRPLDTAESHADLLLELTRDAVAIRETYGRFCIPFDVLYVMIYCYLCSDDLELVANFVFDLVARVARGHYDGRTHAHEVCEQSLTKEVNPRSNTDLHYLVKHIRDGNVLDLLSSDFIDKFGKLQRLTMAEFNRHFVAPNATVQSYAFTQAFPFVLFRRGAEYYGFVCMLGFLLRKVNPSNGMFDKGAVSSAKRIYRFVETYANKVAEFETGQAIEFWTLDYFKLFLGSDPQLVTKFKEFLELLA